jgi:hypothetical protein
LVLAEGPVEPGQAGFLLDLALAVSSCPRGLHRPLGKSQFLNARNQMDAASVRRNTTAPAERGLLGFIG